MLRSHLVLKNSYDAARTLQDPLTLHLRSHQPPPSCIISDNHHHWTLHLAREFGLPRLVFHGFGSLALVATHNIRSYKIHETVKDENEQFVVPSMPGHIEISRAQVQSFFTVPGLEELRQDLKEAESMTDGIVVNSFDDLEPSYAEYYGKAIRKKVWTIGPLSLFNKDFADLAARGDKACIDEHRCFMWLGPMKAASVVHVGFRSLPHTNPSQLIEIGLGLEALNGPFVWAIQAGERLPEVEEWLSAGFKERTRARGLVIRGWAPQVMILMHPAIGGFMTHCGWNSTLESVSAGVPVITWLLFAEQFLNKKLIVDVLKVGVAAGVKSPSTWGVETDEVLVKNGEIQGAVQSLMGESEEAEERRSKAREFSEKARRAVEGGSSYLNLTLLIESMNKEEYNTRSL